MGLDERITDIEQRMCRFIGRNEGLVAIIRALISYSDPKDQVDAFQHNLADADAIDEGHPMTDEQLEHVREGRERLARQIRAEYGLPPL